VTSSLVTHDIEQALEISDRVALLTHGKLRFVGTPGRFQASDDPWSAPPPTAAPRRGEGRPGSWSRRKKKQIEE